MAKTVICRILPTKPQSSSGPNQSNSTYNVVTLEIHPSVGASWRLTAAKSQDLKLQFGDTIKCVSGTAAVLINPGSLAGMFILCPQVPPGSDAKVRTELEINDETTKAIHRGKITFAKDIGNVQLGGTATTR